MVEASAAEAVCSDTVAGMLAGQAGWESVVGVVDGAPLDSVGTKTLACWEP